MVSLSWLVEVDSVDGVVQAKVEVGQCVDIEDIINCVLLGLGLDKV